jgi:hypothetical protein
MPRFVRHHPVTVTITIVINSLLKHVWFKSMGCTVGSTVFGRWPWRESPVCGPLNEGKKRKKTIKFSFPPPPFLPFPYSERLVSDSLRGSNLNIKRWLALAIPSVQTNIYTFRVVFWDILPRKMIVDRRFRGVYCFHHQVYPRRQLWTSYSPPWELEISQNIYMFMIMYQQ